MRQALPATLLVALAWGTLASAPVAAQALGRRIQQTGSQEVQFSFAAAPDVCGDGENIVRFRDGDRRDRINYIRQRGDLRGMRRSDDEAWLGRCTFGPVFVALRASGDRVTWASVRVGEPEPGNRASDLGRVNAQEAVDYLLRDAVPRSDGKAAREIILAAILADSAETWPALLEIARNDAVLRDVRKNAVFWVGQAAAEKATEGLASIAGDAAEDLDVRRHALFALSQQPREVGIPALIDVARTSREPELVKTALFWLGQSEDARALELFREILTRR